jgi:hypothetical protein
LKQKSKKQMTKINLLKKYPPSKPCSCEICLGYCKRPGWWTVKEAGRAIEIGISNRMMLEISPEFTFGVLSPAFKGNESNIALQDYSDRGCNFLKNDLCELHGKDYQPLECRFCHHDRIGLGKDCHADIENDWHTKDGQILVIKWLKLTGLFERYGFIIL